MSYQVLARKWRPRTFQAMVGQEHVLRMLTNALDKQRLHHAYLFTGTRGVGKTTLARLLAKCLNCESGITSKPCDQCATCQAVDNGRFLDLLEIDAASRTKVEDTRELLDNVQYAPTQGRFKIYLIDEVHMLSGHSFNALLKTLEEPPAHVKFLLATTDPKRLPVTILSRCLQFNLKRVPAEQITTQLQHICSAENIAFEIPALAQLADAADGSMRDALSLLDQAIAFCREQITVDDVRSMLGNVEQDYIYRLLGALADQDGPQLLAAVTQLGEHAPDFQQVLENLLSCLHQIAIVQTLKAPQHEKINALAARLAPEEVQLYYQIALIGRRDLPLASHPAQGFEMILLRMLAFKPATVKSGRVLADAKPTAKPQPAANIEKTTPAPVVASTTAVINDWITLLAHLDLKGMTYTLASHCAVEQVTNDTIKLILSKKHEAFLNTEATKRIEEALRRHLNQPITLIINLTAGELDTYAKQYETTQNERLATAVEAIKTDNHVQKIMDIFGATLDLKSIKAVDPT
ncbi:MAG: DNA polymerase III subunit gamma/tau [Pseudomonadota bacterium]